MQAVQKDLMDMLVRELKEELKARDQPKTGNKAVAAPDPERCCARRDRTRAHLAE